MSTWTVVVAAGRGTRFGGDKQLADLSGMAVLARSVVSAASVSDGVVVVAPAERQGGVSEVVSGLDRVEAVVDGGATRSASVRCGLAAVPDDVDVVLVHDGARPLATPDLFRRVVEAVLAPRVFHTRTVREAAAPSASSLMTPAGMTICWCDLMNVCTCEPLMVCTTRLPFIIWVCSTELSNCPSMVRASWVRVRMLSCPES